MNRVATNARLGPQGIEREGESTWSRLRGSPLLSQERTLGISSEYIARNYLRGMPGEFVQDTLAHIRMWQSEAYHKAPKPVSIDVPRIAPTFLFEPHNQAMCSGGVSEATCRFRADKPRALKGRPKVIRSASKYRPLFQERKLLSLLTTQEFGSNPWFPIHFSENKAQVRIVEVSVCDG